ncbi:hypothetical protein [Sphaerochaeta halotolerans]|jgi:hypothetical protein|uniref:hypothetical protein n=1 Tax=Sphaerochaeta halotolerans TaxID=2293840 RepID=UPI001370D435|nr:hypothetical protein [Sphaerochaeta halotolerans]MXI86321.1 hypothetical protein [Sphaerochaeta halotolerans]
MVQDWYTVEIDRQPSAKRHHSERLQHAMILGMLFLLMAAIFLPLWQRGINRSLEMEYQRLLENRQALEEEQQVLMASISSLSMPEALTSGAWEKALVFQPIKAEAVLGISRSNQ